MAEKRVIEYEAASAVENDDWLLLDGVTEGTRKIRPSVMNGDITSAITTLQGDVGDLADNFAEEYDSSESYAVGDYCTHENILYVCTGATTGTWDGTKWTSTDVAEIAENSGKIDDVQVNGVSVVTDKVASIDLTDMQADIDSKQADTKIGGASILDNNHVANLDFLASYGEASGPIASFNDGAAMPLKSLKVGIEATQSGSGDPSPTNIRPITGWSAVNVYDTGVNVWDEEWEVGGLNPLNGDTTSENDRIRSKNYRPCKPNTTMFYYVPSGKGNLQIVFYDINKNYLGYYNFTTEHTFTTPNGCYFFKFNTGGSYGTTYNNDISINYPSTDTEYHAYSGTTYTTQLKDSQGNPMECYGGELSNENGVQSLTNETKIIVLDGSENWQTDIVGDNKRRFTCTSLIDFGVTTTTTFDAISNIYVNTKNPLYTDLSEVFILRYLSQYNQNRIDIMTEAYQDVASFKAFLNSTNMQIVYELATPQTIPQDNLAIASQDGINNLWADSGDILECKYVRDNSAVINDLIARVTALENA